MLHTLSAIDLCASSRCAALVAGLRFMLVALHVWSFQAVLFDGGAGGPGESGGHVLGVVAEVAVR